ncbi:LOW QUALITY PROTEIN: protocadherin-8-like [Rhinatrema bivittatum]|uniref:LOW QUALITY PROTEIN: protocadherin-8-like n=1 Tax=Rhinatrema bivittatum TaxID=194408 RepID=UPI00112BEC8D|nr:LOW QUALITY PROTEIN: protocadherin-8-like [Rhinatrema bivittatum]
MFSDKERGCPWVSPFRCFCFYLLLSVVLSKTVRYRMYEEDEPGTVIGTLSEEVHLSAPGEGSFRLMKQLNGSLLRLRDSDGQLSIAGRIDREQLCRQSPHCALAFDVLTFCQEQFRLLHVEVEVRDINDNSPRFPRAEIPLEVSESVALGTRLPLEIALDEDAGANSVQSFQISANSHFSLEVQTRADGVKYADLVLVKELDRETQASYALQLLAWDGGSPARSGSAAVTVRVLDSNDNSPAFERGSYTVELAEDAPLGSLLLHLQAADPDEGPNGDVVYGFGPQVPPDVRRLFRLDAASGRLTLDGPVDFETKDTYELDVQAQDRGSGPLTAACKVIVRLADVNDNAPTIAVNPLTPGSAGAALITEAAAADSFVALVSTSDRDSGPAGQVRCSLHGHEHFRLQRAYEDSYVLLTGAALDRERIPEYNLTLLAEDLGSPPLSTVRQLTVRLTDENDNAPAFSRAAYEVSVPENNAPGALLTTVLARDPDLGRNGKVLYRLLDAEVRGAPLSAYVSLDPATGAVYALRTFNYEIIKELELRIRAEDGGSPRLSASALLKVKIADQNDNAPVITHPLLANGSAEVAVPGRAPTGYLVTRIQARDADEGLNAELSFSLVQEQQGAPSFTINRASGEIFLAAGLSGEVGQTVKAMVQVTDGGSPSLSATATLVFLLSATAPSTVSREVARASSREVTGEGAEPWPWDVPLIVIVVLAGSCTLLLAAIIAIATTCNRRRRDGEAKRDLSHLEKNRPQEQGGGSFPAQKGKAFPGQAPPFTSPEPAASEEVSGAEETREVTSGLYETQKRLRGAAPCEPYAPSPGYGSESAPPVTVWKGHSFNAISAREAEKFSGKDSGKGDSDFNDSDSDISGEALKKDIITHMQTGLWACTTECKILGHSDRCWSPSCGRPPNCDSASIHPGQISVSSFCKSTSLPRDPLRRDNYYQAVQAYAHIPKTVGLQSVYEKVLPKDYESRAVTLLSTSRPGRLPDLQEITVPRYKPSVSARYLSSQIGPSNNEEL